MGLVTIIYCLRFETSLFVASYNLQGYSAGIRHRLHMGAGLVSGILLLYNIGSHLMENMYGCRFYLATDCISKNSISVDTCLLSRCLGAHGF
jgi:hypothetical protein